MDASPFIHPNEQLRRERIQRNWRQQEVADQLGTTIASVKRWERGSHQPSLYFREKLCVLFEKSAEELGLIEVNYNSSKTETSEEKHTSSSPTDSPMLWTVPYRRNLYFTGRDDLLSLLDQHLSRMEQGELTMTQCAALTQPQAIKGLGGIGKTQIAVEYAYRAREQGHYTHTFWINTASREALMTSFTQIADVLPAFAAKNETNQQKLVDAIKRWLEQCQDRWLLIFDNADDLSLVQESIPKQGNGSILLTTRANAVGSLAVSVEVEKMGFVEGTYLLLRRAQRYEQVSDEEVNEAGNIVVALDHFPLALEQAGAYIEETGCSFRNYLQLYQQHRQSLLVRRGAQTTNYPDSVATTWSLSFQKVRQANPAAAELLQLCAFLAPDHIPEELLTDAVQYWPPLLQQAVTNPFAFDQMLEALLTFSLVKRLAENHMLSIHRLVQAVQMDMIDSEEQRQWAERMVHAVNAVFPRTQKKDVVSWSQCLRYLEQAQVCNTLIQQWQLTLTEGADLLDRSGTYLRDHACYSLAESLYLQALRIREEQLGLHYPDTAQSLNNLGNLYGQQGKYEQAEPLFLRALSIREEQLGPHHPDTAQSLNNLGNLYLRQGKYEQTELLFLRALSIREEQLGPYHPDTAKSVYNLGNLYLRHGKYEQAELLFLRALSIQEQQLGLHHPDTAQSLNNLGMLYGQQGKYEQAEPLFLRAHSIQEQLLGLYHPDTVRSLNNLGTLYYEQGNYEQAESLLQKVLSIHEQHLIYFHHETAISMNNLAKLYQHQGKYEQAESLFLRALSIHEQQLGSHHPDTARNLDNLGLLYCDQRKYEQAESFHHRALAIYEQHLGQHHPDTAESLNNLGILYFQQKKYEQAEPLFARALDIQEQTLPAQHHDLANTLYGFGCLSEGQGNFQKAVALYQRALTIREHVYGLHHPKTIDTRERLQGASNALRDTNCSSSF